MSKPSFVCKNCNMEVTYETWGTRNRNHCPHCLYSLHVDNEIGDRSSDCSGLMKPIGKLLKPDGEEMLIHKCLKCGLIRKNRVAGDDSIKLVKDLEIFDDLPQT